MYRSDIYFTPLTDRSTIDAAKVQKIVEGEYNKAKMRKEDLQTGAVIITGETARKENANEVLDALSHMAGEFVVATAGPDLESVLSAKGAGTDAMSKEDRNIIANIDIGGGTSNIAVFQKGTLVSTSCLDIGGRLVKIENGRIVYIYEKIKELIRREGLDVAEGMQADVPKLKKLANVMAKHLAMALNLIPQDGFHRELYTNDGEAIRSDIVLDGVTFSGGVADVVYHPGGRAPFEYGDIGVLLGDAINEEAAFKKIKRYDSVETIRATVVGAGTHTTEVSGSTIRYERECLPIKNVPVIKMTEEEEKDLNVFSRNLSERMDIYTNRDKDQCVAVALSGMGHCSFDEVQELAKAIIDGLRAYDNPGVPIVLIVENDIGKVLGNAVAYIMGTRKVISIDNIFVKEGDYIDIGEPVANGRVVPVVTKTLIFNH